MMDGIITTLDFELNDGGGGVDLVCPICRKTVLHQTIFKLGDVLLEGERHLTQEHDGERRTT